MIKQSTFDIDDSLILPYQLKSFALIFNNIAHIDDLIISLLNEKMIDANSIYSSFSHLEVIFG